MIATSSPDERPVRLRSTDGAKTERDARFGDQLFELGRQLGDGILISSRRRGSEHLVTIFDRRSGAEVKLPISAGTSFEIIERRVTSAAADLILLASDAKKNTVRPARKPPGRPSR